MRIERTNSHLGVVYMLPGATAKRGEAVVVVDVEHEIRRAPDGAVSFHYVVYVVTTVELDSGDQFNVYGNRLLPGVHYINAHVVNRSKLKGMSGDFSQLNSTLDLEDRDQVAICSDGTSRVFYQEHDTNTMS